MAQAMIELRSGNIDLAFVLSVDSWMEEETLTWRATEWANCLYHLIQRGDFYQESAVWFPAVSVGDTGAASGAVAVCMATRAFARNYAPHSVAVIASSSDGPQRSAIVLRKP